MTLESDDNDKDDGEGGDDHGTWGVQGIEEDLFSFVRGVFL